MTVRILQGDCVEVMRTLPECSIDAIVTDPPYHLTTDKKGGTGPASVNLESPYGRARIGTGFMGMKWDGGDVAFRVETWREALRVLKPGGHLLAFSGTRTYHRMVVAIEDAGFEIRDQIGWLYGSGFPKSLNLEGEWEGWGTALKPAWEPIVVARKPLIGTVAANVQQHGTGALNIDGCRVGDEVRTAAFTSFAACSGNALGAPGTQEAHRGTQGAPKEYVGRWPANVVHDGSDEVLAAFPDAPGQLRSVGPEHGEKPSVNVYGDMGARQHTPPRLDSGSAARFFKECSWQDPSQTPSHAPTVEPFLCLRSALAATVQRAAAIWPSLAGIASSDWTAPSTSVTAIESKALCEAVITATASIGSGFSRDSQHERLTLCGSHVSVVARKEQTGTTTITASLSRLGGCVEAATLSITPTRLDLGEAGCAKRFDYCAKADKADRNEGGVNNTHPTVKPTDLMRYLCRLVTPPDGTVLDPFMGSGSTLKAAELEGFHAIGIELNPDYIDIAKRRIAADAPLFAEVHA